jgi:F-type H+-transporting ATPase subunit a
MLERFGMIGFETELVTITPRGTGFTIFGYEISETLLITWIVMAMLILAAAAVRIFVIPRFRTVPKGAQNILETLVEYCEKFTDSVLGSRGAAFAAYVFTIALMIVATSMTELFGFRPPATDLNFTVAIAVMSFVLINAFGIYYTGVLGRLKWFVKPKAFMLPVNIATHAVIPISLAFRLFGNFFAGMVVMDLIYSMWYVAITGVPALLSIYFNLFHVGIQTYIFLILTLSFMEETVAYGTKR